MGELSAALPSGVTDYTPTSVADVKVQQSTPVPGEGPANLIDQGSEADRTKVFILKNKSWIQYRLSAATIVTDYDITTGNDADERDPKEWTFEGSVDGLRWVVLDTVNRSGPFLERNETYDFQVPSANRNAYLYYRLNITDNSDPLDSEGRDDDDGHLQLSGFRVGGTRSGTLPGEVGTVTGTASGAGIALSWSGVSNATGYYVQRSTEDGTGIIEVATNSTATTFTDNTVQPNTIYVYRVQAYNENGGTVWRGQPSSFSKGILTAGIPSAYKDITALSSTPPTDEYSTTGVEGVEKVTDGAIGTKYLTGHPTSWIVQETVPDAVVKYYTITSGNDYPQRDPKNFRLEGWNSSTGTWIALEQDWIDQGFRSRALTRTYPVNNNTAYGKYRLVVLGNHGSDGLQIAEWRLFGTTSATGSQTAPSAPTNITVDAVTSNQLIVRWNDNAGRQNPETSYTLEQAPDTNFSGNGVKTFTLGAGSNEFRATSLSPNSQQCFRVKASNLHGETAFATPQCGTTLPLSEPAAGFREGTWYEHDERWLNRRALESDIALYADEFVQNPASVDWLAPILNEIWKEAKSAYGSFSDPILYVVAHEGDHYPPPAPGEKDQDYGVAGIVNVSSYEANYRNIIFAPSGDWSDEYDWNLDSLVHEMSHIIEFNYNGIAGSPNWTDEAWGDSKFAGIFQFDMYQKVAGLLPEGFRDRQEAALMNEVDDDGIFWYRDFYFPLYDGQVGNSDAFRRGAPLFNRYFKLLAKYLPKVNSSYARGRLNRGEFLLFLGAAAKVDIEPFAKNVLRWNYEVALEYESAKLEFPEVLALHRAPEFTVDPIVRTATQNVALSGQTLAGSAFDPNGDAITFSKVSGPSWLSVASNGALSGTPNAVGTETFKVKVADPSGFYTEATLSITVNGTECTPETDAAFCSRLSASCGSKTAVDNCNVPRTVASCGSCASPQTCGGSGTPNACGGGSASNPCAGLCEPAISFDQNAQENVDDSASCHETTASPTGLVCGGSSGRTFRINGTVIDCSNPVYPAKRNGGYCAQWSAGNQYDWAYFSTW